MFAKMPWLIAAILITFVIYQDALIKNMRVDSLEIRATYQKLLSKIVSDERKKCTKANISNLSDSDVIEQLRSNGWIEN